MCVCVRVHGARERASNNARTLHRFDVYVCASNLERLKRALFCSTVLARLQASLHVAKRKMNEETRRTRCYVFKRVAAHQDAIIGRPACVCPYPHLHVLERLIIM